MKTVVQQQDIARELLHKLEITDPNCILAGGAPRDWWFDKVANDLDFYVYWGDNTTHNQDMLRLKRLGFGDAKLMSFNSQVLDYGTVPELRKVYEFNYNNEKVQIMVMDSPTFNCVINRFGASVSCAWWKGGFVHYTKTFLTSHLDKVIFIKGNYNSKENYIEKMKSRFEGYDVLPESLIKPTEEVLYSKITAPFWKMLNCKSYKNLLELLNKGE